MPVVRQNQHHADKTSPADVVSPAGVVSPTDQGSVSSPQQPCGTVMRKMNPSHNPLPVTIPVTTSTTRQTRINAWTMKLDAWCVRGAAFPVLSRRSVVRATSAIGPSTGAHLSSSRGIQGQGHGHQQQQHVALPPLALLYSQPARIPPGLRANARRAVQVCVQALLNAGDKVSCFIFRFCSTHILSSI